jgi:acetyltransferase-like isoleucine patch superfamily enzyme/coenzyme F420-reducing hydrogenase beta subunit
MLHIDELKHNDRERPIVYGGYCKDIVTRFESTSGGIFSVFAQAMYRQKGYVGGAVYTESFDVKNVITNDKKDLRRLRSSKYLQSNAEGLYCKIKNLLIAGEKVLVCGSPCQMAALRQYLQKNYDNLIIVDFLCRATNSPKVFHKYLESLEKKFSSKIIAIKDKNKDHGWHSLARKITFADGQVYYGESQEDDYRRGYHLNVYERPSCYECRFKGFPRISDLTIADFWGLNQIDPSMDNNLGTSLIFINSKKGEQFFEQVKDKLEVKPYELNDTIPGNKTAILGGKLAYPDNINREDFFKALDEIPFEQCAERFFPYLQPEKAVIKEPSKIQILRTILRLTRLYKRQPAQLGRMIYWNYLRKEIHSNVTCGNTLTVLSHSVLDIAKTAKVIIDGNVTFNLKRTKGSKAEFRLLVEDEATLSFGKGTSYFKYDSDIQIFKGAKLLIGSCATNIGLKIVCSELIQMGEDVHIGRDVWIRDNNGGHTVIIKGYKDKAPVIIGNHVWICSNVSITKGVTIGDGAIISANSVVTSNIPPHCIASGNPAKVVAENIIWRP